MPKAIQRLYLLLTLALSPALLKAQNCNSIKISGADSVCFNQVWNGSVNAAANSNITWDISGGVLNNRPTVNNVILASELANATGLSIIKGDTGYHAFTIGNNNTLCRIDFPDGLDAPPRRPVTLGNPSNFIQTAHSIKIIREKNGMYRGLITSRNNSTLISLNFGTNIKNSPTAVPVTIPAAFPLLAPGPMDLVEDRGKYFAVIANLNSSAIHILNFDTSIGRNNPTAQVVLNNSVNLPSSLMAVKECDRWLIFISGYFNNLIWKMTVGNLEAPVLTIRNELLSGPIRPLALFHLRDGGKNNLLFSNETDQFGRLEWDSAMIGVTARPRHYNSIPEVPPINFWQFFQSDTGDYTAIALPTGGQRLVRLNFRQPSRRQNIFKGINSLSSVITATGNYTIQAVTQSPTGTEVLSAKSITVPADFRPSFQVLKSCVEDSVMLKYSSAITPDLNYVEWDLGNNIIKRGTEVKHLYSSAGSYKVKIKTLNKIGCANSDSANIKVYPIRQRPVAEFSIPQIACLNSIVSPIDQTTLGTSGPVTLKQWWLNDTLIATNTEPNIILSRTGTYNLRLNVFDSSGCGTSSTKAINVNPLPRASFSANKLCLGDTTEFIFNGDIPTNQTGSEFSIEVNGSQEGRTASGLVKYKFPSAGQYNIVGKVLTNTGCVDADTFSVTVLENVKPVLNYAGSLFAGDTSFLSSATIGNVPILSSRFTLTKPSFPGFIAIGTTNNYSAVFPDTGTYLVRLQITSIGGCLGDSTYRVRVLSQCPDFRFTLTADTINAGNPLPIVVTAMANDTTNVEWDFSANDLNNDALTRNITLNYQNPNGTELVQDADGNWFGFACFQFDAASNGNNSAVRLSFGKKLHSLPTVSPMGTSGLNTPVNLKLSNISGTWYGISSNFNVGNLGILNFGNSPANAPIAQTFTAASIFNRPHSISIEQENDSIFILVSNNTAVGINTVTCVKQSVNQPLNLAVARNISRGTVLTGISGATGLATFKDCNKWYALLVSNAGQLYRLSFGKFLGSVANTEDLTQQVIDLGINAAAFNRLTGLQIVDDASGISAYITSAQGRVFRLSFKNGLAGNITDVRTVSGLDGLSGNFGGIAINKSGEEKIALTSLPQANLLMLTAFEDSGDPSLAITNLKANQSPGVTLNKGGFYRVRAKYGLGKGSVSYYYDSIYVRPETPNLDFCPSAVIATPSVTCANLPVNVVVSSPNDLNYEWDACEGDLALLPQTSDILGASPIPFNVSNAIEVVREGNNFYGFLVTSTNQVVRVDYGSSPRNSPVYTLLPGINQNVVTSPIDVKAIKYRNRWWLFIASLGTTNNPTLAIINLGINITNTQPGFSVLQLGNKISRPGSIQPLLENGKLYMALGNTLGGSIGILQFGDSPLNMPQFKVYNLNNIANVTRFHLVKDCNIFSGVFTEQSANNLYQIHFRNGLERAPSINRIIPTSGSITSPRSVQLVRDAGTWYAVYSQESSTSVHRLSLGSSLQSPTFGQPVNLGLATAVAGNNTSLSIVKELDSRVTVIGNSILSNAARMLVFSFPNNCSANVPLSSSQALNNLSYSQSGIYNLSLTVSDTIGNSFNTVNAVNISNPVIANFDIGSLRCIGSAVSFSDRTIVTIPTNLTYEWNFGDQGPTIIQSNNTNPSHTYNIPGRYTVTLTIRESSGCVSRISKEVTIFRKPRANFNVASVLCSQDTLYLNDNSILGGDSIVSRTWTLNGTTTDTNVIGKFYLRTQGSYTIDYFIRTRFGCDTQITRQINVNRTASYPDFIIAPGTNCFGRTLNLNNISNPNGSPIQITEWDFGIYGTSSSYNAVINFPAPGRYPVILRITNALGCVSIARKFVDIVAPPGGTISTLQNNTCARDSIRYTIRNSLNINSVTWVFHDGTRSNLFSPLKLYSDTGTYEVKAAVTSGSGCTDTLRGSIRISAAPIANFTSSGACAGTGILFTNSSLGNGAIITSYFWNFGNSTSTSENPSPVFFGNPGEYDVSLTVTANGCPNTVVKKIKVIPKPEVSLDIQPGCDSLPTIFRYKKLNADTITAIEWEVAGQRFTDSVFSLRLPDSPIPYNVRLNLTNSQGCTGLYTTDFSNTEPPVSYFILTDSNFAETPYRLRIQNRSTGAIKYRWRFGNGDTSSLANPNYIFPQAGIYQVQLTAYASDACYSVFERVVSVVPKITRNLAVKAVLLLPETNAVAISAEVENKGTVAETGVQLTAEINGQTRIVEQANVAFLPGAVTTYTFRSKASRPSSGSVEVVCVEVKSAVSDSIPSDNKACNSLKNNFAVLDISPNPLEGGELSIRISKPDDAPVSVRFVSTLGTSAYTYEFNNNSPGFYQWQVPVKNITPGYYMLQFIWRDEQIMKRLLVK